MIFVCANTDQFWLGFYTVNQQNNTLYIYLKFLSRYRNDFFIYDTCFTSGTYQVQINKVTKKIFLWTVVQIKCLVVNKTTQLIILDLLKRCIGTKKINWRISGTLEFLSSVYTANSKLTISVVRSRKSLLLYM